MTRSKPESPASRASGDAPDLPSADDAEAAEPERPKFDRSSRLEVELEVSRQQAIGWTIFGLIAGVLLVWQLGTVGVWGGYVLIAIGLYRAFQLVQTLVYPPGTIVVTEREIELPRGLCMPRPVTVTPADVTAVYFLRRSVPWNRSAPVLVVELGKKAMAFPRDWFASESDQRRIVHALLGVGAAKP